MRDSRSPRSSGTGLPVWSGRSGPSAALGSDVDRPDVELPDVVAGSSALRSAPVLLSGLGVALVALLVTAGWAISREAGQPVEPGRPPMTVLEPAQAADSDPADPATVSEVEDAALEVPAESAPQDAAVEAPSVDAPRPGASITGHAVSAELCDALAAALETSDMSELLAAYTALGEVPSPYQSTYRDFAALLSDDSASQGVEADQLSEAFTEAVRVDQVTCM